MRLYVINKFVTAAPSDGGSTRVPTLKVKQVNGSEVEIADNKGKSKALYNAFFYPPPAAIDIDPNFAYPPPKEHFRNVTDEQIHHAIKKLKPYLAPGPNGISNSVFTHCADILVPWLGALYWAMFHLRHYPKCWQEYITIVLRKPVKPDYSNPKAYHPIVLLDMIAKILSSCVAEDLIYMAEKHQMLPLTHFGCCPGRTTTDSLHYLVKWIRDSMHKGLVVSVLFLNIAGAYPNTVIPRLIHNMH